MIDPAKFSITFTPTANDLASAMRWRTWHGRQLWSLIILCLALVCADVMTKNPLFLFVLVLYVPLTLLMVELGIRRRAKKQADGAARNGDTTYTFSDEGVRSERTSGSSASGWSEFERAEESPRFLMLVYPNNFALCLPYRYFADPQIPQVKELVRRALGPRAKLR